MQKNYSLFLVTCLLLIVSVGYSQTRYIDQVFTEVEVETDVTYGVNATIILLGQFNEAVPQELKMDIYQPAGDTLQDRPLVVYFHTGNFIPFPQNNGPTGTRKDSTVVEIANRLAKMGYVCAVASYRQGWNPIADDEQIRRYTLINAAYRGVQDARTVMKFFRRNVAEFSNQYGVDPDKAVVWGQGTGGYISLNTAALDNVAEIGEAGGKFVLDAGGTAIPMVIEQINGDVNVDQFGVIPPQIPIPGLPVGDTLCYPNHVGYSGEYAMAVNLGGALGDTSWIDQGMIPVVSYQVPTDPFAPYREGDVIVPGFGLRVVEVFGAYVVQTLQDRYGNNAAFAGETYDGDFSEVANSKNDGLDGLFPLIGTSGPNDSAPWEWWNPSDFPMGVDPSTGLDNNPDMSEQKANLYIDTIMAYYAPRACEVLGLECGLTSVTQVAAEEAIIAAPVPAIDQVRIESKDGSNMKTIHVYDMQGRLLKADEGINSPVHILRKNQLPTGQYILRVFFEEKVTSQFILFQ